MSEAEVKLKDSGGHGTSWDWKITWDVIPKHSDVRHRCKWDDWKVKITGL